MNKKTRALFIVGSIILVIVISVINILIKRYEQESLTSISQRDTEEPTSKKEMPASSPQIKIQTPQLEEEYEPPLGDGPQAN